MAESQRVSNEVDVALDEFVRAEWMLKPPEEAQKQDLDRERRLFDSARELLSTAPQMKDHDKFEKHGKATLAERASRRASRSRHTGNISLTLEADYDDELAVRTSAIYDTAASNVLGGADAHSATSSEKPKQRSAAEAEAFVAAIKLRDENTKRLNGGRKSRRQTMRRLRPKRRPGRLRQHLKMVGVWASTSVCGSERKC